MVVSCRTSAYRECEERSGFKSLLPEAAIIEIQPLRTDTLIAYLSENGSDSRWQKVTAALNEATPLARTLHSPLYAALAHDFYTLRPGEAADSEPGPAELLELGDEVAIEHRLMGGFVNRTLRNWNQGATRNRAEPTRAKRWLVFIARYMQRRAIQELAWWDLPASLGKSTQAAFGGFIMGVLLLATWISLGFAYGQLGGLAGGAAALAPIAGLSFLPALLAAALIRLSASRPDPLQDENSMVTIQVQIGSLSVTWPFNRRTANHPSPVSALKARRRSALLRAIVGTAAIELIFVVVTNLTGARIP